ncbi:DUF4178 domain-containing protein [Spongiactinospora rosea]|uniref:DUF4178 domain-containing protein n=1 Tax=Spongiactinospora rosea TaxID=2248750 RepID=A0A366LXL8_9ACTN|nr:DUF4178 domain-containing protein [Spongiactinospora rosea]RBQ18517.1 DUF4178 domain-containing protein [Spongiactinospora rosea]
MTSAVVLGLSIAMLALLLVAYLATTRQDKKGKSMRSAGSPPQPQPAPVQEPAALPIVSGTGRAGSDYPDPRTIRVGDTVGYQGVRARVHGALYLSSQGKEWTHYLLDDGTRRTQWLSVVEQSGTPGGDPGHLEVELWTSVPTQGMVPAKSMLIMEGVEFFPIERGTAAFRSEGETGRPERGLLDFAGYRADDGRLLAFERVQGQAWTASYASPLPPGSIEIDRQRT